MIFDDDTINTAANEIGPTLFKSIGMAVVIVGAVVAIFLW